MWKYLILSLLFLLLPRPGKSQSKFDEKIKSFIQLNLDSGVTVTIDEPILLKEKPTKIIIYALPNGNTTYQTFGKKLASGEDWHFDIQHIGAQTTFVRNTDKSHNYIVIYVENKLKSWPSWRRKYKNSDHIIQKMVSQLYERYQYLNPTVTLTGHSGGGSFIFGYINACTELPTYVDRIGFLDATYGYETEKHHQKLKKWLSKKRNSLQVISFNDSVVVFNGKPLVSPTGGTWYRSKLMVKDLGQLKSRETDDQVTWQNPTNTISFTLLKNPEGKIFHTVLVEKNGFIHLLFNGTRFTSKNYKFWGERAYQNDILD